MCNIGQEDAAIGDLLDTLLDVAQQLRSSLPPDRTPAELGADLVRLRHVCDLLELEFSADAARFARTDEYEMHGSVSPADWIRHSCHMGSAAALAALCVGEQAAALPLSVSALEEGRIGYGHMALLASTAWGLRESSTASAFEEQPLLEKAVAHSVSRFRHDCAHARHAGDARRFLDEHVDAVERRFLELSPCEGGVLLRGALDTVGGAALRSALEPLARRESGDDHRDRGRRLADALVELVHPGLDHGHAGRRRAPGAHLQVTASLETVMGLRGAPAGELEFSAPIPAATVQRLACDASITRILLDPDSAVIDVGRSRRVPAGSTRRALAVRDGGCVWPGCDRGVSWTQAHHLVHWSRDGVTELGNLVLLCHRHHWNLHEGGWQIVRTAEGEVLSVPPAASCLPHSRAPAAETAA